MLEQILKRKPSTFTSGTVEAIQASQRRALVALQSGLTAWVGYGEGDAPTVGQAVIVARDGQRFIVHRPDEQPPGETLLEV
jgi:hypothetical protein